MAERRALPASVAALCAVLAACGAPAPVDDSSVGLLADLPPGLLERPLPLVPEAGRAGLDVASAAPQASEYYRQGEAYLAGFDWVPAARSFHAALRLDPGLAVARSGLSRAYLGLESVADAVEQAGAAADLARRRPPPADERRWVELARLQMAAVAATGRERRRRHEDYRQALERALAASPDDPDLLVLRGNAESPAPDGWGQAGGEAAIPWYRRALDVAPDHAPAHHFLTHAYENLGRGAEALQHARRYAELAAAIPHAHHMVGHVAPRTGGWREALERLQTADRLHRASFASGDLTSEQDWHFGHNLRLLAAVELHLGLTEAAERHFAETFEIRYRGRRAGFYCLPWAEYLLSRERFEEALAVARRCAERGSLFARLVGSTLEGEALLALDDVAAAGTALAQTRAAERELRAATRPLLGERVFLGTAALQIAILEGKLELSRHGRSPLLEEMARGLAAAPGADGWAGSVLRLEELAVTARRRGAAELAREIDRLRTGKAGAAGSAAGAYPAGCG